MQKKKITIPELLKKKQEKEKIGVLTAYDFPTARIIDEQGADIILVGDSLGNVVLGYDSTVPVTMEDMLHHTKAAARAVKYSLLVADMPFLSYQISREDALRNAGRLIKEGGADAVKIEGAGRKALDKVKSLVDIGIPVMGHIGLTPQTATMLGGYRVQGKTLASGEKMFRQARDLEEAGCFAVVLECIPDKLSELISQALKIPTIGIGAGPCDGQVLVVHDMLGISGRIAPKFVKKYARLENNIKKAVKAYLLEVRQSAFPDKEHSFSMQEEEFKKLKRSLKIKKR